MLGEVIRERWDALLENITQHPKACLVVIIGVPLVILSLWDIYEGEWQSERRVVESRRWKTEDETICDEKNAKDECVRSHTETTTTYYLTVAGFGGTTEVEVSMYTYYKYADKQPVQYKYREGGVFGVHWFQTISDPAP